MSAEYIYLFGKFLKFLIYAFWTKLIALIKGSINQVYSKNCELKKTKASFLYRLIYKIIFVYTDSPYSVLLITLISVTIFR